jgi:AcrR family transcriptional regulator
MSRSRFEDLEPDRQERVLSAAADEFAERGYDAASLNRIIDRSGISKGSLYYYFDDKADLFATAMERATAMLVQRVGGFTLDDLTAETYWSTIEQAMRRTARALEDKRWYLKLARTYYKLRGSAGVSGPVGRVYGWVARWVASALERGQQLGVVRTDLALPFLVELTMAVGEAVDRWLLEEWDALAGAGREASLVAHFGVFHRLLAPGERLP